MQRGEGSGAERGRSRQGSALPKLGTCTLPVPWRDSSGLWGRSPCRLHTLRQVMVTISLSSSAKGLKLLPLTLSQRPHATSSRGLNH